MHYGRLLAFQEPALFNEGLGTSTPILPACKPTRPQVFEPLRQVTNVTTYSESWYDCYPEDVWKKATSTQANVTTQDGFWPALRSKYCSEIRSGKAVSTLTFVKLANPAPVSQKNEDPKCAALPTVVRNAETIGRSRVTAIMLDDFNSWIRKFTP